MMITKLPVTTALILLAVLAATCGKDSAAGRKSAERDLYLRHCATCHAVDGEGKAMGGLRVPSLKREDALRQTDEQLFQSIYKGSSNMPSFKNSLTEEEIKALVRFIREEIQSQKATP
jgi:mono/diheme cytochrome c family protein